MPSLDVVGCYGREEMVGCKDYQSRLMEIGKGGSSVKIEKKLWKLLSCKYHGHVEPR